MRYSFLVLLLACLLMGCTAVPETEPINPTPSESGLTCPTKEVPGGTGTRQAKNAVSIWLRQSQELDSLYGLVDADPSDPNLPVLRVSTDGPDRANFSLVVTIRKMNKDGLEQRLEKAVEETTDNPCVKEVVKADLRFVRRMMSTEWPSTHDEQVAIANDWNHAVTWVKARNELIQRHE